MATSLVRGRHVVCKVTGRDSAVVLDGAAVYQEDGRIVEIGPYAELAAKYRPDEILGSDGLLVMPGMVDAHHHVGLTPFQPGSPDHPLELWFASRYAARSVDFYLDTLYSAFEQLEAGITTVHHLTSRLGPASERPEHPTGQGRHHEAAGRLAAAPTHPRRAAPPGGRAPAAAARRPLLRRLAHLTSDF